MKVDEAPRAAALALIRLYRAHLSPRKGFRCACAVHLGRRSCSHLGERAIRRHGLWRGWPVLRARLRRCGEVHRAHRPAKRGIGPFAAQRGECDGDCGASDCNGCDLAEGTPLRKGCNLVSCCDCGSCDWPSRKDRRREPLIEFPPNTTRR